MIHFAYPWALVMILLPVFFYYILPAVSAAYGDALRIPFINDIIEIKKQKKYSENIYGKIKFSWLRLFFLLLMWIMTVMALCRPQYVGKASPVRNESRNIMLVVDISNSMTEPDFIYGNQKFDRLTAVKNVVNDFINKRIQDRFGLVLFGTRAYLQIPLTYDHKALQNILFETDAGMAGTSTAIGDALGIALKNMPIDENNKNNQVIVLLTDGENNDGSISMAQSISLAKEEGVKIYTVGVGSDEEIFFGGLLSLPKNSALDEESLQKLANETKGKYFRAKDVNSLMKVYDAIDKLEPQEQEGRIIQEKKELYFYPAGMALLVFVLLMYLVKRMS